MNAAAEARQLAKPVTVLLVLFLCSFPNVRSSEAASSVQGFWPVGSDGAVSLTFDDGMPSQLDRALPVLNRLGIKATFYLNPGYSKDWGKNVERWRHLVADGHELGNHTDKHPCSCQYAFRFHDESDYCLEKLDMKEVVRSIDDAERALQALTLLPASRRSFAYPCNNTDVGAGVGRESYVPEVARRYPAARAALDADNDPATVDLSYVYAFTAEGQSADQMIASIERAMNRGRWAVIVFHGIGSEWDVTDAAEFDRLMEYLARNRPRIWVAPFVEVADYVRVHRAPINP